MEAARGKAVIVMDADLQDPPEVVQEMIARWKEGYDVVYARRVAREGESAFKRWTAACFYRLLSRLSSVDIPQDVGDFRLVDRKVLDAFLAMPEQDRFVRGMFAWLGFRQTAVDFRRPARAAGETKYPLWKMLRLAVNAVIGFSDVPLKMAIWAGARGVRLCIVRRPLCDRALPGQRSRHGLDVDHRDRFVPFRHQSSHERDRGPVCRAHSLPKLSVGRFTSWKSGWDSTCGKICKLSSRLAKASGRRMSG